MGQCDDYTSPVCDAGVKFARQAPLDSLFDSGIVHVVGLLAIGEPVEIDEELHDTDCFA